MHTFRAFQHLIDPQGSTIAHAPADDAGGGNTTAAQTLDAIAATMVEQPDTSTPAKGDDAISRSARRGRRRRKSNAGAGSQGAAPQGSDALSDQRSAQLGGSDGLRLADRSAAARSGNSDNANDGDVEIAELTETSANPRDAGGEADDQHADDGEQDTDDSLADDADDTDVDADTDDADADADADGSDTADADDDTSESDDGLFIDPLDALVAEGEAEGTDDGAQTFDVTVDGETVQASLNDLKKAFAGEGAIEKRLQEATEARQEAFTQLQTNVETLQTVLGTVGELLFKPQTTAPAEALAQDEPLKYLQQKDAHETELRNLAALKDHLGGILTKAEETANEARQELRKAESVKLAAALPILRDQHKGPKVRAALIETAKAYGFTDAMIQNADFHGHFLMAADALRWRRHVAQQQAKAQVSKQGGRIKPTRKSAQPTAKSAARRSASREQRAMEKARKSGDVDDVAATITQSAPKRRTY